MNRVESNDETTVCLRGDLLVLILRTLSSLNEKAEPENTESESASDSDVGNDRKGVNANVLHSTPLPVNNNNTSNNNTAPVTVSTDPANVKSIKFEMERSF